MTYRYTYMYMYTHMYFLYTSLGIGLFTALNAGELVLRLLWGAIVQWLEHPAA